MKYCDKCHVDVLTNQKYCPLCHQVLQGEHDDTWIEPYPKFIPLRREILPLTKKIILFITIVAIVTLLVINLTVWEGKLWSLIPIGSILYVFMIVRYGVLSRQNIAFKLALLTTVLILLLNMIDQQFTEDGYKGWAINYVTPLALLSCNVAISAIIWIRRIDFRDYIFYLLAIMVFSLVPIILCLFNIITVAWPSIAALGLAIFILLIIVFFFPKSIKDEIKKRFHL
ncbi:MAG: DUF6320 domain-containing protein [Candidatus Izemoplasmatales bacterium]|jgi:membrane-associated HD superfamily phosphohydrolase|nr:DUF6320 domain-containing protein [Candidatus Izemoplasmatales bacterium]MDD3865016.1 DUF6320 domain-containing protein [Candidatus Izemoplasmatales bacterium]